MEALDIILKRSQQPQCIHSPGGLSEVPSFGVHSMGELRILIWGHDFHSLSSIGEQHLHHPLASPLQQVLKWHSLKQCNLAALSSLFYCLCFVVMDVQLRLISVWRQSEFSTSPREKSLTGNKRTMVPLCSEGKQQLNDELHTLFCCCCKYISNDS